MRSPDSDFPDEVWVGVGVVELFHRACGKELCGVPMTLYDGLQLLYDVRDC